jgi:hypothetical protein
LGFLLSSLLTLSGREDHDVEAAVEFAIIDAALNRRFFSASQVQAGLNWTPLPAQLPPHHSKYQPMDAIDRMEPTFADRLNAPARSALCMRMVDRVHALISRLSPEPVCDTCVAERLSLASTQAANIKVREVVGSGGYERRRDICSLCFNERLVTRRL